MLFGIKNIMSRLELLKVPSEQIASVSVYIRQTSIAMFLAGVLFGIVVTMWFIVALLMVSG